jgi:hypothetical protein
VFPSVNETTVPAEDQDAVKKLGKAMPALLRFMFECPTTWEIQWQKIDLSDGFWRMIVSAGAETNFVFQLPPRPGDNQRYFVVPSALQMGWMNSPPYFSTTTDTTKTLQERVLALSATTGIKESHRYELKCLSGGPNLEATLAELKSDAIMISQVFVDDFMNGLAGLPNRESKPAQELWLTRAAMHSIHAVFPPPEILNHQGGKDSISQKKVDKGDAKFQTEKEMLGVMLKGAPGSERLVGLPLAKRDKYVGAIQEALDSPAHRVGLNSFQKIVGKLQFAAQTLPAMWGFFTPLYQAMLNKGPREFVGLGKRSEV